jgi:hypothetical protein
VVKPAAAGGGGLKGQALRRPRLEQQWEAMTSAPLKVAGGCPHQHYAAWGQAIRSRCHRDGVALKLVNPAYSSLIGRVKFAASLGLSVHHSAAMVIARRGMNLSERLPKAPVSYPDGEGSHVTLDPVANTGHRHVWSSWAKAAKAVNAALAARFSVKASPSAGNAPKTVLDDAIPTFCADAGESASREDHGEIPWRRPDLPVDGRLSSTGSTETAMRETPRQPASRIKLDGRFRWMWEIGGTVMLDRVGPVAGDSCLRRLGNSDCDPMLSWFAMYLSG